MIFNSFFLIKQLYAGGASSGMVQLGKGKAKNINESKTLFSK